MSSERESLWTKWRQFRSLPPFQRKLVFRAMAFLPLTEAGLRVLGFSRWKALIERLSSSDPRERIEDAGVQSAVVESIARAARSAEVHGFTAPNCLERSLTLWWLLRRHGIEAELRIGGRKNGSRFEAHAWVESGGAVVNESPEVHDHYARFDAPIAAAYEDARTAHKADSL